MNQKELTLKNCESYLYDAEVYKRYQGRDLKELFVNSPKLLPKKQHSHLSLYTIEDERLIYLGMSPIDFAEKLRDTDLSFETCFVIVFDDDEGERVYHLVSLNADFLIWDQALIVRKDFKNGKDIVDMVLKKSDFMTETYFKRFFINFPLFLLEHGIKGAYPILASRVYNTELDHVFFN